MDEITEDGTVLRALSVREAYAKGKADMRERAAKLACDKAERMGGISDQARHLEHIGKQIRALSLETGDISGE